MIANGFNRYNSQHLKERIMQKINFNVEGEFVELNQLLKLVGLCDSGGAGKLIVASGDVKVDGKQELRKTAKIRPGQMVELGDVQIRVEA
jgi:ribosome-associated protein